MSPWLYSPSVSRYLETTSHASSGGMMSGWAMRVIISRISAMDGGHFDVLICSLTARATSPASSSENISAQMATIERMCFSSRNLSKFG